MLTLKSVRIPLLLATRLNAVNGSTVATVSTFAKTLSTPTTNISTIDSAGKYHLRKTWSLLAIHRSQNGFMFPQFAMMSARFNANQPQQQPSQHRRPTPPSLPDKQQLEKYFFRTLAFIWDTSYWLFTLTRENFNKHIMANPKVQSYLKELLEKMEKSKKD